MSLCNEFKNKIIDFFENNVSKQEYRRLSNHLEKCRSCQTEYDRIKAFYGILDQDIVPVPEQTLFDRIKPAVKQQEIRFRSYKVPRFLKILIPSCAIALLMIFIFRPEKTVDISIPTSVLLEDETIAGMSLGGVLNDQLIEDLLLIEEDLPIDVDESITEFSDEERLQFIDILYKELNGLQEEV